MRGDADPAPRACWSTIELDRRPALVDHDVRRVADDERPGPDGSGGVPRSERVDERDDPRAVAEQDLHPDLVEQLADAVHDLARLDRPAPAASTSA